MQQQPLAFTLVKTVVSARDDGKALSPALATAWDLLKTELSPAHRVIASEVKWSPTHQEDLRFVIDGIKKQFDKDPELEGEFLAFLAEVDPFAKFEEKASILPMVLGGSAASGIASPASSASFEFDDIDTNFELSPTLEVQDGIEEVAPNTEPALDSSIEEPAELDLTEIDATEQSIEAEEPSVEVTEEIPTIEDAIEEASEFETVEQPETPVEEPLTEAPDSLPTLQSVEASSSIMKYWPIAAGTMLVAAIAIGVWTFSGSPKEVQSTVTVPTEILSPKDSTTEIIQEPVSSDDPPFEYSAPSISRLSHAVDSLRLTGDYALALAKQQELTERLKEEQGSSTEEMAQAYSELAILYSSQENRLQAIVEQRKSLAFARQAFAKTDPTLGRSHLKLAKFYTENKELHMARAHLQQARQIFGHSQDLVSPTDLEETQQLTERIRNAS